MLTNSTWTRPQDWDIISDEEKSLWNDLANDYEQFYRDMRKAKHINTGLSSYGSPLELKAYHNFLNILEDQDKMYNSTNILWRISSNEGGLKEFSRVNQKYFEERDLSYLVLSQFCWSITQTYETFLNIVRKTLVTDNLVNRRGACWPRSISETPPDTLFDLLHNDSELANFMKDVLLKNKLLRNAISHGLIWYEAEQIFWVDNIESSDTHQISFLDFVKTIREQSLTL